MRNDHHDHENDHDHARDHDRDHDRDYGEQHSAHDDADGATPPESRPLGFWLHTLDRLIDREVESAFADLDVTRREWRLLNLIGGAVRDERLLAELDARPHRLDPLLERGWVAGGPGAWTLTDAGRETLDVLTGRIDDIRSRVAGAVPAEDFATTMATLEAISRELGWSEEDGPRGLGGPRRGRRAPRWGSRRGGPAWGRPWHSAGMPPFDPPQRHADARDSGWEAESGRPHGERCGGPRHHGHHDRGHHDHRGHGRRGRSDDVHLHVHLHDRS